MCWGYGEGATMGYDPYNNGSYHSMTPLEIPGITDAISLSMTANGSCTVTRRGKVLCWGRNDLGQLGRGTVSAYSKDPMEVTGLGSAGVASVAIGYTFGCALMKDGVVKCWGGNSQGELGNGTTSNYSLVPVTVQNLPKVVDLRVTESAACVVTSAGGVKCWGEGGGLFVSYDMTPRTQATDISGLTSGVSTISINLGVGMARMVDGTVKTWGANGWLQMGQGSTSNRGFQPGPISTANGPSTDASPLTSQGTVLINNTALSGTVAGHITPLPWSMTKTSTGTQALMVSFDPLAAAAAMFIEQYDAHVAACNATTSENTSAENTQRQGNYLWACSNPTSKSNYLSGMLTLLKGARHYLFGSDNGSLTVTGPDPVHYPYTFVVPDYTSTDTTYYGQLQTALNSYNSAIISSNGTRLEKTMQLAGIQKFTTSNALVSTRVTRSAPMTAAGLDCVVDDGFSAKLQ
jgi:hypothetical protein